VRPDEPSGDRPPDQGGIRRPVSAGGGDAGASTAPSGQRPIWPPSGRAWSRPGCGVRVRVRQPSSWRSVQQGAQTMIAAIRPRAATCAPNSLVLFPARSTSARAGAWTGAWASAAGGHFMSRCCGVPARSTFRSRRCARWQAPDRIGATRAISTWNLDEIRDAPRQPPSRAEWDTVATGSRRCTAAGDGIPFAAGLS